MSNLTVVSNGHYREILGWHDLTLAEQSDNDWDTEQEGSYFKYRGHMYSLDEFMRISEGSPFDRGAWDGYSSDSYFSGVLIQMSNCGDGVKVGRYWG